MSGGRERSMDAKSDAGRAQAGKEARGGGLFGGRSLYGGGGGFAGGTTNEMAKRLSPRVDVPVTRTVDTAPRGLPNRTNEPGERVPSHPFAPPLRGILNMLDSIGPIGTITAPFKEEFGLTLADRLGLQKGPQVGTSPTQTRSNLPGGSGVGGSVNSGGALGSGGYWNQPAPPTSLGTAAPLPSAPEPLAPNGILSAVYPGGQFPVGGPSPYYYTIPQYNYWMK